MRKKFLYGLMVTVLFVFVLYNGLRAEESVEFVDFPGQFHRDSLTLSITAKYKIDSIRDLFLELKEGATYIAGKRITIVPGEETPSEGETVISLVLSEKLNFNTVYTFNLSIREKGGNWLTQKAVSSVTFQVVDKIPEKLSQVFVSTNGNDTNDGTIDSPLRTLQAAADMLDANGTCFIRGGVYRETVNVKKSGQTFTNYNGEYVLITGLDTLSDWSLYKDNIYKAPFSDFETEFTQVFLDGNYMQMARYPNNETGQMMNPRDFKSGYAPCFVYSEGETGPTRRVVFDNMTSVPDDYWKGGYFRAVSGYTWMNPHGVIASSTGNELQVIPKFKHWEEGAHQPHGSGYGFIFHLNALDTYGEWFAQDGYIYLMPPQNSKPDDFTIEAQKRQWAFVIDGISNVKLKGIHIKAASIKLNNANNCVIDSCSVRYLYPYFTRYNYGASFSEQGGIYIKGDNNTISNSYIAHSWGNGICLEDGNGNTIENCILEDLGWDPQFCSSILTHANNTLIKNCTLGSTGRFHIRFKNRTDILYCDLYDCMKMGQDAGSIESTIGGSSGAEDLQGTEIAYNIIHDCNTLPKSNNKKQFVVAFYLEDVFNYTVHHNLVYNIKTDVYPDGAFCYLGPRRETISNVSYYNNTIWNCDKYINVWNRDGLGNIQSTTFANNLYDARMKVDFGHPSLESGFSFKTNYAVGTPELFFSDYEKGDFTLKETSPVIDKGTVIPGITDDYSGAGPDVGAFEYGKEPWVAGANLEVFNFEEVKDVLLKDPDDVKVVLPRQQKMKVFPNPLRKGQPLIIKSPNDTPFSVIVYCGSGRKFFSVNKVRHSISIPGERLPKGMAVVEIIAGDYRQTYKILVQ